MTEVIVAIVTFSGTAFAAWLVHKRESRRGETADTVATAALHTELDTRMKSHVVFVEARMMSERRWYEEELHREREECDGRITDIAARLHQAELRLAGLPGAKVSGGESGVSTD
jgi:hypothetical protein